MSSHTCTPCQSRSSSWFGYKPFEKESLSSLWSLALHLWHREWTSSGHVHQESLSNQSNHHPDPEQLPLHDYYTNSLSSRKCLPSFFPLLWSLGMIIVSFLPDPTVIITGLIRGRGSKVTIIISKNNNESWDEQDELDSLSSFSVLFYETCHHDHHEGETLWLFFHR